jgi:hypothetical protein
VGSQVGPKTGQVALPVDPKTGQVALPQKEQGIREQNYSPDGEGRAGSAPPSHEADEGFQATPSFQARRSKALGFASRFISFQKPHWRGLQS